jgi:hypothetical protein
MYHRESCPSRLRQVSSRLDGGPASSASLEALVQTVRVSSFGFVLDTLDRNCTYRSRFLLGQALREPDLPEVYTSLTSHSEELIRKAT